ncbi:hypothetical protein Q5752_002824 [Cryptotrichosporon argae]
MDGGHGDSPCKRRIRHITGIRINRLTLDAHGSSTAAAMPPPAAPALHSTSSLTPHHTLSRRERRVSNASYTSLTPPSLSPSTSTHALPRRVRAPTLAGEAMGHDGELAGGSASTPAGQATYAAERAGSSAGRLARSFVALRMPEAAPTRSRQSLASLPGASASVRPHNAPPPDARARTGSLPSRRHKSRPALLERASSDAGRARSPLASPSLPSLPSLPSVQDAPEGPLCDEPEPLHLPSHTQPAPPFFLSPIHRPSHHPAFLHLDRNDSAPWLSAQDAAAHRVVLELWVEDGTWTRKRTRLLDLCRAVAVDTDAGDRQDDVWLTFEGEKGYWRVPADEPNEAGTETAGDHRSGHAEDRRKEAAQVVEKSIKETRMKKGPGVGALHQLFNLQAVVADTQRSIDELRARVDAAIKADCGGRALRRDVGEREHRVAWIKDRVAEVERTIEDVRTRDDERRRGIEARKDVMRHALDRAEAGRARADELDQEIGRVESERDALLPRIHQWRAHHAQALDALFPIVPLAPASLLYTILGVPLPIPADAKDPAPPLAPAPVPLPDGSTAKIDERAVAAALGYAALVLAVLGGLGTIGAQGQGGLAYPVTFAGSRSMVRDVVSSMQGPRSFPLYARGVERYRYEYAVFLLNKDIELLMLESNIRLLDMRHTLPNLKNLLLTLSSPALPGRPHPSNPFDFAHHAVAPAPAPARPGAHLGPGSGGGGLGGLGGLGAHAPDRRHGRDPAPASRQTSAAWTFGSDGGPGFAHRHGTPGSASTVGHSTPGTSPTSSAMGSPGVWGHRRRTGAGVGAGVNTGYEALQVGGKVGAGAGVEGLCTDELDEGEETEREKD